MDLSHPHFAEPEWLCLAVFGPLALVALQIWSVWARKRQLARIASQEFLADLTASHSPVRRAFKNGLLVLTVAGIGLALARPQWGERQEAGELLGEDIVFVLDCSRSMLAADVAPSRFQRARLAVLDFIQRHRGSRVGLVAFAGEAFLQCPLTFDYSAFEESLMAMDDRTIPIPGTDIGMALDEAFRAMPKGNQDKLVVLVTDGEDLERGGTKMAEALAQKGVVVFTVGVGTPAGAEIQAPGENGRLDTLRDKNGDIVRSRLDETTLRAIAHSTRGEYFPLGHLGEGLAQVQQALEARRTTLGSTPARKLGVDRFYFPVAAVLFLLLVESLIGTRRIIPRKAR